MDIKRIITFFIYGGSFVLFVIGFAIPYWLSIQDQAHLGLWQTCSNIGILGKICVSTLSDSIPGKVASRCLLTWCWLLSTLGAPYPMRPHGIGMAFDFYRATQALETLGLIAAAGGLFLCVIGAFFKPGSNIIRILAGLAGIAAAGCIIIGVIIFGAKKDDNFFFRLFDLSAGFVLAIISSIGLGISGILCLVIKSADSQSGETRFSGAVFGSGGGTPGTIITPGK